MNKVADHYWPFANIVPSVVLLGNTPDETNGSFYSGGDGGDGEIHVVLHYAMYDPSDVFGHCAQLYSTLIRQSNSNDRANNN
eukprot:5325353-Ditylum_brightwellii.AAC.1